MEYPLKYEIQLSHWVSPVSLKSSVKFSRNKKCPGLNQTLYLLQTLPLPSLKFNCALNWANYQSSQIRKSNLFEICRVEMKRKIELRDRTAAARQMSFILFYTILIEFHVTPNWTKIQFSLSRPGGWKSMSP